MRTASTATRAAAALLAVSLVTVACGSKSKSSGTTPGTSAGATSGGASAAPAAANNGKTIIWGSTDPAVSYDPAGSYDLGSWNVVYNVYQTLLRVDEATQKPIPDAATGCTSSADFKVWTCKLKSGLKFSNGDPLTSADVKFSFDRILTIKDPNGPGPLIGTPVTTAPDAATVVFTFKDGNSLWNQILATGAGAIVDSKVFPPNKLEPDGSVVGSGPYKIKTFQAKQIVSFVPNTNYAGDIKLSNSGLILKYYQDENALKTDIEGGKVDVAYRNLTPATLKELATKSNIKQVAGPGGEIRYIVFNTKTMPGDNDAQKLAIRQAMSYLIDRSSIAKNVYSGTVDPLYSMVPKGLDGATTDYESTYGSAPDKAKAAAVLSAAGVKTPLSIQLWWTPAHYGTLSSDEYTELKRQFEAGGLFKVNLQSTEWQSYSKAYATDKYPIFELGWFPDYPDTDDYVGLFYGPTPFFNGHYVNKAIDALLTQEKSSTDAAKRTAAFKAIQALAVKDAPTIPVWQGKQIAVQYGNVTGLSKTLLPDYIFRFWVLGKS
ncbi:MAG: peptide/nickel transport system substrate-binding protein [Frankiales bacterium]|jgi:peptide/nickel transport system substrate-binding protein|nr:peptide/nickel transport system substrate-binding protein [Frankiales bacterium]